MSQDSFNNLPVHTNKIFYDFAVANDKCGALKRLQSLSLCEIEKEVIESGYSMIGSHHGKPKMMRHAVLQIGVKTLSFRPIERLA